MTISQPPLVKDHSYDHRVLHTRRHDEFVDVDRAGPIDHLSIGEVLARFESLPTWAVTPIRERPTKSTVLERFWNGCKHIRATAGRAGGSLRVPTTARSGSPASWAGMLRPSRMRGSASGCFVASPACCCAAWCCLATGSSTPTRQRRSSTNAGKCSVRTCSPRSTRRPNRSEFSTSSDPKPSRRSPRWSCTPARISTNSPPTTFWVYAPGACANSADTPGRRSGVGAAARYRRPGPVGDTAGSRPARAATDDRDCGPIRVARQQRSQGAAPLPRRTAAGHGSQLVSEPRGRACRIVLGRH